MNDQLEGASSAIRESLLLKLYLVSVIAPYFLFTFVMFVRVATGHGYYVRYEYAQDPWFIDPFFYYFVSGFFFIAILFFMGLLTLGGVIDGKYPKLILLLPLSQLLALITGSLFVPNVLDGRGSILVDSVIFAPLVVALLLLLALLAYKPSSKAQQFQPNETA